MIYQNTIISKFFNYVAKIFNFIFIFVTLFTQIQRTILEMSFNQKNSPKKLFAGASKKNNYLQNQYQRALMDKNTNGYIACLTEDSEPRNPQFGEKIDKKFQKIVVRYRQFFHNSIYLLKFSNNFFDFIV